MATYRVTRLFANFSGNLGSITGSSGQNFPSGFNFNSAKPGVNINAINNSKNIADVPKNMGDIPGQTFKSPVITNEKALKGATTKEAGGIGEKIAETWKSWGKQGTTGTLKKAGVIGAGILGAGLLAKGAGLFGGGSSSDDRSPAQAEFSTRSEFNKAIRDEIKSRVIRVKRKIWT